MRQEQNSFWIFESIVSAPGAPGALSWSSFAQPETVLRTNKLFLPVADWVQLQRASTATGCQNILAMSIDVEPLTTIHHNSPQFTTRLSNSTWQWWVQQWFNHFRQVGQQRAGHLSAALCHPRFAHRGTSHKACCDTCFHLDTVTWHNVFECSKS